MRVLGIDVGLKRTGLALSDETGTAIRYLPNLHANSRAQAIERILSMVHEFSLQVIVIGCPTPRTDASAAIGSRASGLKKALDEVMAAQGLNVTIYLWNESHSSKRAIESLVKAQVPQKKRKILLDAASAAILIEEFLQSRARATDNT